MESMKVKTKIGFTPREFESSEHGLITFLGYNGNYCIHLNAKCVHSVKTKSLHIKKLNELIKKYELTEITN
jgi:hypothetical protein